MRNLIIVIAIALLLLFLVNRFVHTPPAKIKSFLRKFAITGGAAILILLVVTGRLHWFFGLLGGLIPIAQRILTVWRTAQRFRGNKTGKSRSDTQQTSSIETQFLRMSLDHTTGQMTGTVLKGMFSGRKLDELGLPELLEILDQCNVANDQDSVAVMESYLDRYFAQQWRTHYNEHSHKSSSKHQSSAMSVDEAYDILGLKPGATTDEIKTAYKKLIQQFHPDRGGSSYLASKINMAKKLLLKTE